METKGFFVSNPKPTFSPGEKNPCVPVSPCLSSDESSRGPIFRSLKLTDRGKHDLSNTAQGLRIPFGGV